MSTKNSSGRVGFIFLLISFLLFFAVSCGGTSQPKLFMGGIPDQDFALLEERFEGIADYLSRQLDVEVQYVPSTSYAALVTAFENGDVMLGWFGALSGIQARLSAPGAVAIAQRPIDTAFTSVFILNKDIQATLEQPSLENSLENLRDLSFTFGSETSTSGHLMPYFFLVAAGIDPQTDFAGRPNYSGSHDKTLQFVENGSYEAGVLNSQIWKQASDSTTQLLLETEPYFDYHWLAHPDLDETFGAGITQQITQALLDAHTDSELAKVLELFQTDTFIPTQNSNYDQVEEAARSLDLLGP